MCIQSSPWIFCLRIFCQENENKLLNLITRKHWDFFWCQMEIRIPNWTFKMLVNKKFYVWYLIIWQRFRISFSQLRKKNLSDCQQHATTNWLKQDLVWVGLVEKSRFVARPCEPLKQSALKSNIKMKVTEQACTWIID